MSQSEQQRAYFDTGALSALRLSNIREYPFRIVYSDAHLTDLENSTTPELELQFLKNHDAHYIDCVKDRVEVHARDPFEAFDNRRDLNERYMAPLLSFFSGGGPDQTDQEAVISMIETLTRDEPLLQNFIDLTIKTNGLTNRTVEQAIDKWTNNIDVSQGLSAIFATMPTDTAAAVNEVVPDQNPTFQGIINSLMVLGLMGFASSKGIRKRNSAKSQKVARHDWIDNYHIAFGLHCFVFGSNDKAARKRARLLVDYWLIGTEVVEIRRR